MKTSDSRIHANYRLEMAAAEESIQGQTVGRQWHRQKNLCAFCHTGEGSTIVRRVSEHPATQERTFSWSEILCSKAEEAGFHMIETSLGFAGIQKLVERRLVCSEENMTSWFYEIGLKNMFKGLIGFLGSGIASKVREAV